MANQPPWRMFEHEVGLLVRAFGYDVEITPPSNDFGADVVALKKGRRVAIQCKLYGTSRIGHPVIISLSGAKSYYHADEAICFTTTKYSKQAVETARHLSIHLVDGDKLMQLCREVSFTLPSLSCLKLGQKVFSLNREGLLTVGRGESCEIRFDSKLVSRTHANLLREGGCLMIEDLTSTNGTFLNGTRITTPTILNYGDHLVFGDIQALVVLMSEEGASKKF